MSVSLSLELSSPSSSMQSSSIYSDYSQDGEPQSQSQVYTKSAPKFASKKSPFLKYPAGIQRLTRRGLCTYGINTGPVPDDTDWTKLTVAMLREQLVMREMPDHGKKAVLVERLENLETYKPEAVAIRDAPDDKPFGPISRNASSNGEKRFFVDMGDQSHISAVKKAMKEDMFVIKQSDDFDGGVSISVHGGGPDTYGVTIGSRTSCTCSSMMFRPRSNCKHIIYVMTHVFRAPAELLPQRTLFTEEVMKLFDRAPKIRFTAVEASMDPSMSDGVPKSKDGKSCPVCFKHIGKAETVCCGKCGNHTHSSCFGIYTRQYAGWSLTCPVCQGGWSVAAV
ncbi:SAP domain-containing protein [Colletotrichum orchidophilum]|uniref:Postreplication repair E3 ubiquitin-protein ligase RAD18 n=1 Tax=Colletotrichum orchidophilum TaxID=1209926 RepID=A0A1G4BBL2_9PEZI|nr:SAP domain-containing protein [Colletotrichum orchidophilum]OHE98797.1 SAP domain-containing protein [Colletotrichum orchidophilum]